VKQRSIWLVIYALFTGLVAGIITFATLAAGGLWLLMALFAKQGDPTSGDGVGWLIVFGSPLWVSLFSLCAVYACFIAARLTYKRHDRSRALPVGLGNDSPPADRRE
jgi:hypothetical protein